MDHIVRFGFDARRLPLDLSLALGSGTVTPLELATGYAVFANGGHLIEPYLIDRIEGTDGRVIYKAEPRTVCVKPCEPDLAAQQVADSTAAELPGTTGHDDLRAGTPDASPVRPAPRVIPSTNAYQMVSMMKDVIRSGTGAKALVLKRDDLAGKTGTTNDLRDAWFSGYNTRLVTTVWVGFDIPRSLGQHEVGGVAALPIWIDFMRVALKDDPESSMPQPAGMITVRIDPQTGLLAHADSKDGIFETFRADQVPKRTALESRPVADGPYQQQPVEIPEQLF